MKLLAAFLAAAVALPAAASDISSPNAFTVYGGRISTEATWHDVLLKPYSRKYSDTYIVSGAYSRAYKESHEGALRTEYEVNLTYNYGRQDHWELNLAPVSLRWQRFPWNDHVRTSLAFGLGVSYAFDYPELERELENDTQQFLLFWMLELTAGQPDGPWSAVLRLHHRSPGWGVVGVADGGMNAPSLGFRYRF